MRCHRNLPLVYIDRRMVKLVLLVMISLQVAEPPHVKWGLNCISIRLILFWFLLYCSWSSFKEHLAIGLWLWACELWLISEAPRLGLQFDGTWLPFHAAGSVAHGEGAAAPLAVPEWLTQWYCLWTRAPSCSRRRMKAKPQTACSITSSELSLWDHGYQVP